MSRHRLAIVVSHPIQHFVPLYRALALRADLDLKVFFASRIGIDPSFDAEMNTSFAWAGDLLEGYDHRFLEEADSIEAVSFRAINNPSLGSALREFSPSVVLVYGYAQLTALRAIGWARMNRVPVIMAGDGDAQPYQDNARSRLRSLAVGFVMRQVSAVLTVGDQNEIFWSRLGVSEHKQFRSPFPIDETVYRHARQNRAAMRMAIRRRFDIPDEAFIALFVGKLSERKRPADLLAAAAKVKADQPLHVLFCGNGPILDDLQEKARETGVTAHFAGFVNLDRLPLFYCAADTLVIGSEHDPHPLVGSEACAIGLPLIVSDRVGLIGKTDIARPDVNARIYPCGDVDGLVQALQALIGDPKLRDRMAAASLRIFEDSAMRHSINGLMRALDHVGKRGSTVRPRVAA